MMIPVAFLMLPTLVNHLKYLISYQRAEFLRRALTVMKVCKTEWVSMTKLRILVSAMTSAHRELDLLSG